MEKTSITINRCTYIEGNNITRNNDENLIITSALGDATSRPNNQYGILINEGKQRL